MDKVAREIMSKRVLKTKIMKKIIELELIDYGKIRDIKEENKEFLKNVDVDNLENIEDINEILFCIFLIENIDYL